MNNFKKIITKSYINALILGASLLASSLLVTNVQAGTILQADGNSTYQVNAFEPFGQSFTAEDASVKFSFNYWVMNSPWPNDPLEIKLLSGDGLDGTTLKDTIFSIPSEYYGFFDVDFSDVQLDVGSLYTVVLSVPGNSPYWGITVSTYDNPYTNGRSYFGGVETYVDGAVADFSFRVTPIASTAAVPEPGSIALIGLGLLGFAASRRKSAKHKNA